MAATLAQRVPKQGAMPNRRVRRALSKLDIAEEIRLVSTAARRWRLRWAAPTAEAIGDVWRAHPENPMAWPSQQLLARMVGVSERTIRRHIAALKAAGLLMVFPGEWRHGAGGRLTRRTNRYLLCSDRAKNVFACPLPRRRRPHLEDTSVPRPPDRGAVPAPPPSRPVAKAPQLVDPPPVDPSEVIAGSRQALAEVRAVLAQARRSTR